MRKLLWLLAASLIAAPGTSLATDARLQALFDAAWEADLRDNPTAADYLGDHRYSDQWPDLSAAALEARYARYAAVMAELKAIPRDGLSGADRLNYDLFAQEYERRLAAQPFKPWLYEAIRPRDGVQSASELAELLPFATVADYEAWIVRLTKFGTYIDQHIAMLATAIREGRTQPRSIMQRIPAQLANQIPANAEDSPFFAPFTRMPEDIGEEDRARLIGAGGRAIVEVVIPAFKRLDAFFRDEYLPAARSSDGIWDTPDGLAFYANRTAFHTTTDLTPDDIHEIGLREVARIRAEMDEVIARVRFQGTFEKFLAFLRTDPQFYYGSGEELFTAYAAMAKRIDPELVKLFGKLPRTPYGVREIPMTSAPDTTTAYYQGPAIDGSRAGYYYVNLYRPEVRPKYEIPVLTVHEAVPGHHLQIALAMEDRTLPLFRRNADFTAYVEGWALYSERLGEQMGLYDDPYDKFGQLTYDMWRAVRLVVDTGIHARQWTRQQAIDYFKANAAKTEADIVNEVDRYIAWPGQALAYKIGQLRILDLRREAQAALGGRFDIRAFHDTVLASGPVPMDVLTEQVHAWINSQKQQ
ncbi:MAG TPA: DUF885 domain-containing protein [Steroidobacteraceae bacterium]|nr:DUF885 domain-containing protein [Steroidobacteraceae bacterium]HNS27491.1 DUF885 domain-containing protein [Steroidobacteraceae bacterium]